MVSFGSSSLSNLGLYFRSGVFAALFIAVAAIAQKDATTPAAPVPSAIRSAQKIFVSNGGADSRLFETLFKGDSDRAYNQLYAALNAAGHHKLVDDPSEADLVLELELRLPPAAQANSDSFLGKGAGLTEPVLRLTIYDRKAHYILWTLNQKVEFANRGNNRDHNFDDAISALASKFEQLAGKQATAH